MARIVTFGEIMMRLNPPGYYKFVQANSFDVSYAGGEANVAVSLANYGHNAAFCTKVPEHGIGQCAVNALRRFGVDTGFMLRGGDRLGVYYVEKGASQRPSKVIYDRAYSAIAQAKREEFHWEEILADANWFHWTGITPALSESLPDIVMDAMQVCRRKGITVSCDLNYRGKLWTREAAGQVMNRLVPFVDVLIANEEDAADVFGIAAQGTDVSKGQLAHESYINVAKQLAERFECKSVAITLRGSLSASENQWAGLLYHKGQAYFSRQYLIKIVDRVGGGDSFGGALIHALQKFDNPQDVIEFAAAASCLKQTIEQDYNLVSEADVLSLARGNASGRVQR